MAEIIISTAVDNPTQLEIAYLLKNKYRQLVTEIAANAQSVAGILSGELDFNSGWASIANVSVKAR